jgi:3-oxoacyl-(acyl-carrier-protein) synthase
MKRRVVVTGVGVVAPNGIGVEAFTRALREGRSGIRAVPRLRELGFGCQVAGVPEGADARVDERFDEDDRLAMNSNHRYACLAALEAWETAGLRRPERGDDAVDWDAGAILGTGIGGMDTIGERVVPTPTAGSSAASAARRSSRSWRAASRRASAVSWRSATR